MRVMSGTRIDATWRGMSGIAGGSGAREGGQGGQETRGFVRLVPAARYWHGIVVALAGFWCGVRCVNVMLMRAVSGISACLLVAMAGVAVAAPPPMQKVAPVPAPAQLVPAEPRSLWYENVVEMRTARRSGVTSTWLASGVRVHHLKIDTRPGQVVVTIALSGGKLLEDAASRGVTEIAAGVLDDWETAAPNASAAERMAGRDIRLDAGAGLDAITLQISGAVADAGAAMRVLRELLTAPTVTPAAVEQSRERVVRELRLRAADARAVVSDAINTAAWAAVGGAGVGDARLLPPDERGLRGIDADRTRAWIQRHIQENGAPIEAAIVGDITLAEALTLVDTTLGTLPARARVNAATNAHRRIVAGAGAMAPVLKDVPGVVQIGVGRATVVRGCFGPELGELAEQRTLRATVRLAIARVKSRLARPELGVVAGGTDVSGGVYISPFIGRGMVLVTANADASRAAAVGEAIDAELSRLATEPVPADELAPIAAEQAKSVGQLERDAPYWSAVLARCDALGMDPDEIASGAAYYKALTPERARDVLRKYCRDEARIALTIRGPEKPGPENPGVPVEGGTP